MSSNGSRTPAPKVAALLAAGTAAWERAALEVLAGSAPQVVLVKRCLDLTDLLAAASTGTAQVAVVSDQLSGLDADSVDRLARHGVRTIVVATAAAARSSEEQRIAARTRLLRLGVARVLDEGAVDELVRHVQDAAHQELHRPVEEELDGHELLAEHVPLLDEGPTDREGRLVAVWGPGGAPGRTTVAVGIAAEAAARGRHVTLIDADPYGGAVAQHLAVLEEVSGLLAAARLANTGRLDRVALAGVAREVAPRLRLVTGLPRPDRWAEVRTQAYAELLAVARALDDLVVVDTGFSLPSGHGDPFAVGPARDDMTAESLEQADEVVVVGAADPVGLTRLARGLPDLLQLRPAGPLHVAVNRMRPSLGWSEKEVRYLVEGVAPTARVTFLPDDRSAADRALVSGRTLAQSGDSSLRRAVAALTDGLLADPAPVNGKHRRTRLLQSALRGGRGARR